MSVVCGPCAVLLFVASFEGETVVVTAPSFCVWVEVCVCAVSVVLWSVLGVSSRADG